jgi:hypothetical protein
VAPWEWLGGLVARVCRPVFKHRDSYTGHTDAEQQRLHAIAQFEAAELRLQQYLG